MQELVVWSVYVNKWHFYTDFTKYFWLSQSICKNFYIFSMFNARLFIIQYGLDYSQ